MGGASRRQADLAVEAKRWLFEAQLVEYETVRQEMTGAISNQHLVLTFGTASILGAFAVGVTNWSKQGDPAVFFCLPLLVSWVLGMWLGEVVRMLRAVEFCGAQAQRLRETVRSVSRRSPDPLYWEEWRRDPDAPRRTITWTYVTVIAFVGGAWVAALVCGFVDAIEFHWPRGVVGAVGVIHLLYAILVGAGLISTYLRWFSPNAPRTGVGMPETSPLVKLIQRILRQR